MPKATKASHGWITMRVLVEVPVQLTPGQTLRQTSFNGAVEQALRSNLNRYLPITVKDYGAPTAKDLRRAIAARVKHQQKRTEETVTEEALTPALVRKLETYLSIYPGDKELRGMVERICSAIQQKRTEKDDEIVHTTDCRWDRTRLTLHRQCTCGALTRSKQ